LGGLTWPDPDNPTGPFDRVDRRRIPVRDNPCPFRYASAGGRQAFNEEGVFDRHRQPQKRAVSASQSCFVYGMGGVQGAFKVAHNDGIDWSIEFFKSIDMKSGKFDGRDFSADKSAQHLDRRRIGIDMHLEFPPGGRAAQSLTTTIISMSVDQGDEPSAEVIRLFGVARVSL
jgi:hypothetical protein